MFNNNTAEYGGALCSSYKSYMFFKANSFTGFINNIAKYGGAIHSSDTSYIYVLKKTLL